MQIMSNKDCYLKAPALRYISKALLFRAFAHRKAATRGVRCTDPHKSIWHSNSSRDRSRLLQAALGAQNKQHSIPMGTHQPVLMV